MAHLTPRKEPDRDNAVFGGYSAPDITGEIELASGQLESGRARLAAFRKEASARGFVRITDTAASAGTAWTP